MGTPDFAVPSLEILVRNGYQVVAVVTAPDKPGGRGLHLQASPVKVAAAALGIPVLQPQRLKDPEFLQQLASLGADLQVVVAFRMLPEAVWAMPRLGTFNLHASLLPQYRGAAPIQRAVMNGETQSGLTTFMLQQEIDTGGILLQETTPIADTTTGGELHDRMMMQGAELVLRTVRLIEQGQAHPRPQVVEGILHGAPKIFKEECSIHWGRPMNEVYNFIRGLSPHPAAHTLLQGKQLKIFFANREAAVHHEQPGTASIQNGILRFAVPGGYILPTELQLEGKKKMGVDEFLRGNKINP